MQSFVDAAVQRAIDAQPCRVVVTTGNDRDATATGRSQQLCETLCRHGVSAVWASRYFSASRPQTLTKLSKEHNASAVLVVDGTGTRLQMNEKLAEFKLHGGLGVLRLRNVLGGGEDALCSTCGLREGDVFVDATAGQCQDAIVAAAACGSTGRVIAIEASPLLWAVTSGRPVATGDADVDRMLNERIEVRLGEHTEVLAGMPSDSCDVVYFDPMWQKPAKSSPSFGVLRGLACSQRLSAAAIEQARRVARRAVVVMDQSGGEELGRLGLEVKTAGQRKQYGVCLPT